MTNWQPIDSAPRDGSTIDLWLAPLGPNNQALTSCRVPDCFWADGRWCTVQGLRIWDRVTHWMPLPPPPQEPTHD